VEIGLFTMRLTRRSAASTTGSQWDFRCCAGPTSWVQGGLDRRAPRRRWEPIPASDLLVAQGAAPDQKHPLGPGGFLLPYHHPASWRIASAMLDHLAQGRLTSGGGQWLAERLGDVHVTLPAKNREMTRESLDIILSSGLRTGHGASGEVLTVNKPGKMYDLLQPHIVPFRSRTRRSAWPPEQEFGHAQNGWRARLPADEPHLNRATSRALEAVEGGERSGRTLIGLTGAWSRGVRRRDRREACSSRWRA